ncbi:glycosyltransferase family 4 protein [Stygiolobus caldivivus]|uniref:Glycosyl transferase family 1 n=1 Tax=Stygiolobus caldivivus TaxID=2824673 RepID=A0A8D5U822_9CREN|nr:glycosyltransferase family 4 protein [Stygiolobus caldivivus]BCU71321.1 glycosyl transferase family 1 [Stygiolobus caldivivus]
MNIFVIANIFNTSGVYTHIKNVTEHLVKLGHSVTLYTPYFLIDPSRRKVLEELKGVQIHPLVYSNLEKVSKTQIRTFSYFISSHLVYLNWNNLGLDRKILDELPKFDIVYDMHEDSVTLRLSYHVAKKAGKPLVKLLHDEPFRNSFGRGYRHFYGIKGWVYDSMMYFFYKFDKEAFLRSIKDGVLRGIAGVSPSSFFYSGLDKISRKYNIITKVYKPGNAFDKEKVAKYRKTRNKENYAVYFARLVPQKGLYELPKIADKLETKIVVCGRLYNERDRKFLDNKKIEYKGYVLIEDLYKIVANAKVLIYPSHQDGFSLVVLDALALGTTVAAYDIPAVRFVYGGLKPVKVVKEYDTYSLSKTANEVIRMNDDEYESEHEDEKVRQFLDMHSSWENVAKETEAFLLNFVKP